MRLTTFWKRNGRFRVCEECFAMNMHIVWIRIYTRIHFEEIYENTFLFNCKKCYSGFSQYCKFKKPMETSTGIFCTARSVVQGFHNVVPWRNIWEHIPKKPIELQGGWFRISFSVETSRNTWEHIHVEMHQVQCRIFTRSSSWCSYTNTNWREPILLPRVLTRIFYEW